MATEIAIAPSVNRFPNSCDLYEAGILVYGSLHNIIFLDLRTSPPLILDEKCIMGAHRNRVSALSILKDKANEELLVSAGDDEIVKVWDLNSRTSIASTEIKDCHAVSWFSSNTSMVIAAEFCNILKWSYKQDAKKKIKTGCSQVVLLISHHPANDEIIATGHRLGMISVINLKTETALHKLKAHSLDITSLSWSSVSPDVLLSTSLDMSARVWKLGEAQPIHVFYCPNSRKMEDRKQTKFFGIFHPDSENRVILFSRGELGALTFKEKEKPEFRSFGLKLPNCPYRGLYCLQTWSLEAEDVKKNILCAIDPNKILCFDLKNMNCALSLTTTISHINKMEVSPINPSLMALCCGDSSVKIYTEPSESCIQSIWILSKMKILCGSFHPSESHVFAFGTDEGRIGIIDLNRKKYMYSFETHHKAAAYSVCWAPCSKILSPEGTATEDFFLYSSGSGSIYINKLNEPKSPALDFDEIISLPPEMIDCKLCHSDMSWKQDYSCIAVSSFKGFIDLYDAGLSFLGRLIAPASAIESLCWHPDYSLATPDSPLKTWLACGGKFCDIHIFDTAEIIEKGEKIMMRSTRKLAGHTKGVVSLRWSFHTDEYLASGSRDGTAQVWNAVLGTCIANYSGHRSLVASVLWNIENPDVLMSAGWDGVLRIWKISEQTEYKPPPAGKIKLLKRQKFFRPKTTNVEENAVTKTTSQPSNRETVREKIHSVKEKKGSETEVVAASEKDMDVQETKSDDMDCFVKRVYNKKSFYAKKTTPVFPHFAVDHGVEGIEDCKRLVDLYYGDAADHSSSFEELRTRLPGTDDDALKFGIFADQLAALSMLEAQSNQYKKDDSKDAYEYLQAQMLNVRNMIEEACKNGKITDFLLSLAPMVSYKYWLEVCEKYALQLIQDENYRKGSLYLLMCGKLHEAINLLAEKGNIYDALALAKIHLPESDPLIEKLLLDSAIKFRRNNLFAFEAQCFIALKDPISASRALCHISDPNGARIAVHVCKKFGLEAEASNCALFCLDKCLGQLDWVTAKKLTEEEESMKPYSVLVDVHEILYAHIRHLKKENGVLVKKMFCHDSSDAVLFWKGQTCKDSDKTLISHIYSLLKQQRLLTEDVLFLEKIHEALNLMLNYRKSSDVASEAHISIALYLAQYMILALKEDFELAAKYFLKIFDVSCNVVFLPKIVSMLLLPIELQWSRKTNSFFWEAKKNASDSACPIIHFYGLYSSFGQLIAEWELDGGNTPVISADCLSNLPPLGGTIRNILSRKSIFDLLAAYFAVSFLNDLQFLISKQKLSPKCCSLKSLEEHKSVPAASIVEKNTQDMVNSNTRGSDIRRELEDNNDIAKLIELALKEASEKAEQLLGVEKDVKIAEENSANGVCNEVYTEPDHIVENGTPSLDCLNVLCPEAKENNVVDKVTELALEEADVKVTKEHSERNVCTYSDSEPVIFFAISANGVCDAVISNAQDEIKMKLEDDIEQEAGVSRIEDNKLVVESSSKDDDTSSDIEIISCVSEKENSEKNMSLNSISRSKEENATNGFVDNVSAVHESNSAENDEKLGEASDDSTAPQFGQTQKMDDDDIPKETVMSHELCLEEISTFCNVVKLMCNIVCRDEFALFYYLQDLVKYINQKMASNLIQASRTSEKTATGSIDLLEKDQQKEVCATEVVPREQKETEFQSLDGVQSGDLGDKSNGTDFSTPLNSSTHLNGSKNDGQIKECDTDAKQGEASSSNSRQGTPDSQIFYDCSDKEILPAPSNELRTGSDKETNCSGTIVSEPLENIKPVQSELQTLDAADLKQDKSCAQECVPIANQPTTSTEQEGKELQVNSECENGGKVSEERVDENDVVDPNHASSSPKNTKYLEEKKEILELINVLESEHKEKPYPNPFVAASKAVQACSNVFHKSACHEVRRRVHELAHEVLVWVEKFAINQKPCLSCDICKNAA